MEGTLSSDVPAVSDAPAPWAGDHDCAEAERRLRTAYPHLSSVSLLDEGWDFRVFECDGEWLFRVPKRPECVVSLQREVGLLSELRLPVATPRYADFDGKIGGYRKLPGPSGMGREPPAHFAADLAATLRRLHGSRPATTLRTWKEGPPEALSDVTDELQEAEPVLETSLVARCRALLDVELPPPYAGVPRLIHADIFPEHVLCAGDRFSGLVDWGDAGWGDPAWDFAVAYYWGGERLLQETTARYSQVDERLADRSRFAAALMAVGQIAFGARSGSARHLEDGRSAMDRFAAR